MSKNRTILQQLFQGELFPAETINALGLQKISDAVSAEREYLSGKLSGDDKDRLQKMNDLYQEYINMYGEECFVSGFKFGALLLIEVFSAQTNTNAFEQTDVSG